MTGRDGIDNTFAYNVASVGQESQAAVCMRRL